MLSENMFNADPDCQIVLNPTTNDTELSCPPSCPPACPLNWACKVIQDAHEDSIDELRQYENKGILEKIFGPKLPDNIEEIKRANKFIDDNDGRCLRRQ